MKKMIICAAALAGLGFGAQRALAGSVNDQVEAFRAERHILDGALVRCNELVAEKYQSQLYGLNAVSGEARKPIEVAANAASESCKVEWARKAQALFDKQSPEVKAFYKQRSEELKAQSVKVDGEAAHK